MIKPIEADHPLWGYRRVWLYLKYRMEYPVGINRVHRLKAKRGPIKHKPIANQQA
jgi:hypothetical protein